MGANIEMGYVFLSFFLPRNKNTLFSLCLNVEFKASQKEINGYWFELTSINIYVNKSYIGQIVILFINLIVCRKCYSCLFYAVAYYRQQVKHNTILHVMIEK